MNRLKTHRALPLLTALLAGNSTDQHWQAMRPNDWYAFMWLATGHLVAPALYTALARRPAEAGLHRPPPDIADGLQALWQLNRQRNTALRDALLDTVRCLNAQGLQPLLLKGAISLLPGGDPDRVIGDLDILFPQEYLSRAEKALRDAGFRDADASQDKGFDWSGLHHLPPLFHPDGLAYVELHHGFSRASMGKALDPVKVWQSSEPIGWNDVHVRLPNIDHRWLHNCLHDRWSDRGYDLHLCSLRQLHESVQLRQLPDGADIDWPTLLAHAAQHGVSHYVHSYLLLAQRLMGEPLPDGANPTLSGRHNAWRTKLHLAYPRRETCLRNLQRLPHLPLRLLTPSWYPAKYRHLKALLHNQQESA